MSQCPADYYNLRLIDVSEIIKHTGKWRKRPKMYNSPFNNFDTKNFESKQFFENLDSNKILPNNKDMSAAASISYVLTF